MSSSTTFQRIASYLDEMTIIDSHEHLPNESYRLESNPDFMLMFSHYCVSDMLASGMTAATKELLFSETADVAEKWRAFKSLYARIRDGSYSRAAHIAMKRFYDMDGLENERDAQTLTERIRAANTPGLYQRVLKDACRIETSMNFLDTVKMDRNYFTPVPFVSHFSEVTVELIRKLEESTGTGCTRLDGYLEAMHSEIEGMVGEGAKGLKIGTAYQRNLDFSSATTHEAEKIYNRIIDEEYGRRGFSLGYEERMPLQNYIIHRLVETAAAFDIPVVFHTGLQTDNDHRVDDTRATQLWSIAHRHRNARIVVLHAGFPWMEDAAPLAKQYPNIYLDLGWTHLMSPTLTRRALRAYVDLVPMHKILGFGGDYIVVEKVYGHLHLAKLDIAGALSEAVGEGALTADRAEAWCDALLYKNPKEVYRL